MEFYRNQPLPYAPTGWGNSELGAQAPQWFRLLTVAPGVGEENLELQIEIHDLLRAPPYEALSYCWGKEEAEHFVILSGWAQSGLMMVRPNLQRALLRLRLPTMHRRLWVDAICIDQENDVEKSGQIQIMRDIYGRANRTVVWLGPGDQNIEAAFVLAKSILETRDKLPFYPGRMFLTDMYGEMREHDVAQRGEAADKAWESLKNVFATLWFRRVWVIQEIVASSWSVFLCGNAEASFCELLSAVPLTWTGAPAEGLSLPKEGTLGFWNDIYEYKWGKRFDKEQPFGTGRDLRLPLKTLIQKSANFDSTDPRDQIFGLLGICRETSGKGLYQFSMNLAHGNGAPQGLLAGLKSTVTRKVATKLLDAVNYLDGDSEPSRPRALDPDYTKPLRDVYRDITRFLLFQMPCNLEILSLVQHDDHSLQENLPSWVPRYHRKSLYVTGLGHPPFWVTKRKRCCSEIEDNVENPIAPERFVLSGVRLGLVQSTGSSLQILFSSEIDFRRIWSDLCPWDSSDIYSQSCGTYFDGDPINIALGLTLIAGQLGLMAVEVMKNPSHHKEAMESRTTASAFQTRKNWMREAIDAHIKKALNIPSSTEHTISRFSLGVLLIAPERKLFWTSDGRLGLGPKIMLPGDILYALHGGRAPFVLRQQEGHYILIGEAYIHDDDIMFGIRVEQLASYEERLEIR